MKAFIFIIFFSIFSLAHDHDSQEEKSDFFNFIIYLTDCQATSISLNATDYIMSDKIQGFYFFCQSNYYFAGCLDSLKQKTFFSLKQNKNTEMIYENKNSILVTDFEKQNVILNQNYFDNKNTFSNLICKGAVLKNINELTPKINLNNGIQEFRRENAK